MSDPVEEALVERAARDALETLNDAAEMQGRGSGVGISSVTKFVRSGNKLIRVHVSFVVPDKNKCRREALTTGEGE